MRLWRGRIGLVSVSRGCGKSWWRRGRGGYTCSELGISVFGDWSAASRSAVVKVAELLGSRAVVREGGEDRLSSGMISD